MKFVPVRIVPSTNIFDQCSDQLISFWTTTNPNNQLFIKVLRIISGSQEECLALFLQLKFFMLNLKNKISLVLNKWFQISYATNITCVITTWEFRCNPCKSYEPCNPCELSSFVIDIDFAFLISNARFSIRGRLATHTTTSNSLSIHWNCVSIHVGICDCSSSGICNCSSSLPSTSQ